VARALLRVISNLAGAYACASIYEELKRFLEESVLRIT
jgi:hypothetical protein